MTKSVCLARDQIAGLVSVAVKLIPAPGPGSFVVPEGLNYLWTPGSDFDTDPLVFTDGSFVVLTGVPVLVDGFFVDLSGFYQWASSDGAPINDPTAANWERHASFPTSAPLPALAGLPVVLACDFGAAITENTANDCVLQIDVKYHLTACGNPYPPRVISQQYSQ